MEPILLWIAENRGIQGLSYGPNTYVLDLRVNIIISKAGLLQPFFHSDLREGPWEDHPRPPPKIFFSSILLPKMKDFD